MAGGDPYARSVSPVPGYEYGQGPGPGPGHDRTGLFLKITVEDNGIGVSEDARHLLFRPFQKAQAKVRGSLYRRQCGWLTVDGLTD